MKAHQHLKRISEEPWLTDERIWLRIDEWVENKENNQNGDSGGMRQVPLLILNSQRQFRVAP